MPTLRNRILAAAANAVFPPRCRACGAFFPPPENRRAAVGPPKGDEPPADVFGRAFSALLCGKCLQGFIPVRGPVCRRCGLMVAGRPEDDHFCADCLEGPALFSRARAAGVCDGVLLALLHRFKYDGCTELVRPLAGLLLAAFQRHFGDAAIDAVVPVPLHAGRLRSRGFNQAELLARSTAAVDPSGAGAGPLLAGALVRRRPTAAQAGLGKADRAANIRGAFAVGHRCDVAGKRVLLIDDVYTTGATVSECSRVLAAAGAGRVDVLTLARAM